MKRKIEIVSRKDQPKVFTEVDVSNWEILTYLEKLKEIKRAFSEMIFESEEDKTEVIKALRDAIKKIKKAR